MQLHKIQMLLGLAALGAAENNVGASDVPSACLPACQFTIDLSARCDRETDDDDEYTPCVCEAADSRQRLTECASCVKDNGRSDPDDNDVADLMDDCGWDFNDADVPYPTSGTTTTVVTPSSTTADGGNTITVTQTPSETPTTGSTITVTESAADGGNTLTVTQTSGETPTTSSTITVTESSVGSTNPPTAMAGALNAKAVVGPLVAGLILGLPVMLG